MTSNTSPITAAGLEVGAHYRMVDDYLDVLALEKSGFKGMRLIVSRRLLDERTFRECQRDWPAQGNGNSLGIVTRLHECTYPDEEYADVLWMADADQHFKNLRGIMASRFKRATGDPDELTQAAWTRAVFDQVDSLVWSVRQSPRTGIARTVTPSAAVSAAPPAPTAPAPTPPSSEVESIAATADREPEPADTNPGEPLNVE